MIQINSSPEMLAIQMASNKVTHIVTKKEVLTYIRNLEFSISSGDWLIQKKGYACLGNKWTVLVFALGTGSS